MIDANGSPGPVFWINSASQRKRLSLSNLTLTGGLGAQAAGLVVQNSDVDLRRVTINDNNTPGTVLNVHAEGAALVTLSIVREEATTDVFSYTPPNTPFVECSLLHSTDCLAGPIAGVVGGSLSIVGETTVSFDDSLFEGIRDPWDNAAYIYQGGTVYLDLFSNVPSYIRNSSFVSNQVDDYAETVTIFSGVLVVNNSTFYDNQSAPLKASNDALLSNNYSTLYENIPGPSIVGAGNASVSLRSSIVWHNNPVSKECAFSAGATFRCKIVQTGPIFNDGFEGQ